MEDAILKPCLGNFNAFLGTADTIIFTGEVIPLSEVCMAYQLECLRKRGGYNEIPSSIGTNIPVPRFEVIHINRRGI